MRVPLRATWALVVLIGGCLAASAQTPQDLLQQLQSDNADQRLAAARALAPYGPEVMGPLAEMLGGEDKRLDLCARLAIEFIAYRAAGPEGAAQREAVAKALADIATSNKPLATRVFAVRQLALCGGDEVLPVMWHLLMFQPEMHETARAALADMPGEGPVDTLKRAVFEVGDPAKEVGLLNALAPRASVDLYPVGAKALEADDESVRIAALNLLAHVPDAAAAEPIRQAMRRGADTEKRAARQALAQLGDTLLAAGKRSAAQALYLECAQSDDGGLRAAGIGGLGHTGGPGALARLMAAMYDSDPAVRGAALYGLATLPGEDATLAIAGALDYSGSAQHPPVLTFIRVLADRRDAAAMPALLKALTHQDAAVRAEAMRAIGKIGDPSPETVRAIVSALGVGEPDVLDAAEFALARLTGDDVTNAIAKLADDETAHVRRVCISALGYHTATKPFPTYVPLHALEDEDEGVQLAAIRTLSRLGDPATVASLFPLLESEGATAEAAQHALSLLRGPGATDQIVAAIRASEWSPAVQAGLIAALAPRDDPAIKDLFAQEARSADDAVAIAALDALARLRDPAAADVFLARLNDASPDVRRAALRGYLAIAEAREKEDGPAALAIYQQALGMDVGAEEKQVALRGIGRLADVNSLPLVEPYLTDPKLKGAAAEAVLPIALKVRAAGDQARAITLCREVVEATRDRRLLRDAASCLREMGVDLQLAAQRGCIVHWWVLGPFPNRERATKQDFVPVGERIDLTKTVQDADKTLAWKYVPVDDPLGLLDFEKAVARMDNCGAYAYAEVESDRDQDVLLKFGSDDSVFCWLNGEQVHAWDGNRGWAEDQDTVKAHLKAGTNSVLCKVINGGAQWSLSVRITDPDGRPLQLSQRSQ
jgi:HEAT repeat protein